METLLFALRAELRASPPKSAFDVIQAAYILLRDTGADVAISELVKNVADSDEHLPPDVLQALRIIIHSDLVESIAKDLRVAPQCKCSLM